MDFTYLKKPGGFGLPMYSQMMNLSMGLYKEVERQCFPTRTASDRRDVS